MIMWDILAALIYFVIGVGTVVFDLRIDGAAKSGPASAFIVFWIWPAFWVVVGCGMIWLAIYELSCWLAGVKQED